MVTKKKTSKKVVKKQVVVKKAVGPSYEKILVQNFVQLQKVMTDLSFKFEGLTKQISSLLHLFEDSAEALVKKEFDFEKDAKLSQKMLEKMDNLFEQNKIIAKGLTLVHDTITPNQEKPFGAISKEERSYDLKPVGGGIEKKSIEEAPAPRVKEEDEFPDFMG